MNFIARDFIRLSQLKYSSNVIEKCLETSQAAVQVDQILKGTHYWADSTIARELSFQARNRAIRVTFIVQRLVTHQYGNYVIQKALAIISDQELRQQMLEAVKPLASSLQGTKHGLKVLNRLQKLYPLAFGGASGAGSKAKQPNANGITVISGVSGGTKKNIYL